MRNRYAGIGRSRRSVHHVIGRDDDVIWYDTMAYSN